VTFPFLPLHYIRCSYLSYLQEILEAPEKFIGLYMGMNLVCLFFCLCSVKYGAAVGFPGYSSGRDGSSLNAQDAAVYMSDVAGGGISYTLPRTGHGFVAIGGLSCSIDDAPLFWTTFGFLLAGVLLWAKLVWFDTDPGIVYTRDDDFESVSRLKIYIFITDVMPNYLLIFSSVTLILHSRL
jgi:hypothetical protein